ncbi:CHRD domain-containing protein [Pseudanabaena sp. FACHB-1998]|uniref:CHRD domain-containing protein n=1 Tax=Pseudanabaena sp. FACHB-1998 TaxID=2692858 RepID=UPI0016805B92|nr:CHRD domain-containing protein [Pseudanabaena sp. FACHB-1998]MBD2177933.1 CHRD domain-containing protein [Pseudanabaena sp. FACHB-1998]
MIQAFRRYQKFLFGLVLGLTICLLAINSNAPAQSHNLSSAIINSQIATSTTLATYQQQAEAELIAQNNLISQSTSFTRFAAILSGDEVYPNPVSTTAAGVVGAALRGNRLIVRGGFYNLSSPLRDYATDPLDPPNPKITSGVHIHRGAANANGPFQYALEVKVNPDNVSGNVKGEYTLTDEQLQALNSGGLYVDIHTKSNRAGELRGILKVQT